MGSLAHLAVGQFGCPSLAMGAPGVLTNPYMYGICIASVLGAIAIMLIMPGKKTSLARLGGLIGLCALGGFWVYLVRYAGTEFRIDSLAFYYQYLFSALAIGSAVRVITHKKPVFSALWFIMVVLATSGLLLTLNAEFVAFAMIIIYGGAILVTYVFVIMLASHAGEGESKNPVKTELSYDSNAKDPIVGTIVGFALLTLLLTVILIDDPNRAPVAVTADPIDESVIQNTLPNRKITGPLYEMPGTSTYLNEKVKSAALEGDAVATGRLDNSERVGVDLFKNHPLGLELAGVILLLSLVGAVVIARKRVETEGSSGSGH